MKKALIIYGSTTGNTESAAGYIESNLMAYDFNVTKKDVSESKVGDVKGYDIVLLGSSTWGEGDLQDDFIDFYDAMDGALSNEKIAVFGCGDSSMFPHCFCEAVDKIELKAKECGAKIITEGLKVDGDVDDSIAEIEQWVKGLV